MREKLEAFNLETVKDIAKEKGIKVSGKTKAQLIDMILEIVETEEEEKAKKLEEEDIYKSPRMIRYHFGPDLIK